MKLTPLQFTLLLATPVIVSVLFAIAALIFAVRMHVFAFPPRAIDETKLQPASRLVPPALRLPPSFHAAAFADGTHRPRSCAVPTTVVPAARGFIFAAQAAFNLRAAAHTGAGVQPRERGPEQSPFRVFCVFRGPPHV